MKVLFTVNTYYPSSDGVQKVTEYQAEGLAAKGHKVTVFTPLWGNSKKEEWKNGVRIRRFNIKSHNGYYSGDLGCYVEETVKEANSSDVLITVAIQCVSADLIIKNISRITCKKVLYLHGIWDFKWNKNNLYPPVNILYKIHANTKLSLFYYRNKKNIRQYDVVTHLYEEDESVSFFSKKLGYQNNRILGNAVDEDFFITHKNNSENKKDLLFVANYNRGKNQIFLLDSILKCKSDNFCLTLIGSEKSKYYLKLKKYIENHPELKEKINLLINVPRSQVIEKTRKAYIYLCSSLSEKQPVSIMEAMSAAVPFISTDVGCVSSFPGGIIVSNPKDMANKIDLLLSYKCLPEKLSEEGREYAEKNFRLKDKINQFENILESLCSPY